VDFPHLDTSHPWVRERKIQGVRPEYFGLCPGCVDRGREKESNGRVTP
jgi:hypothetical protein